MAEARDIAVAGIWPDAFVGVAFVMIFSSSLFAEVRSFIKVGGKGVCKGNMEDGMLGKIPVLWAKRF